MDERPDYGNWVPAPMIKALWGAPATVGLASVVLAARKATRVFGLACAGVTCAAAGMSAYMTACRREFDFEGGALMGQIHQIVVDHLPWNGQGTLLDVGCGAGALTIRCAKAFPQAQVHGVDMWGANWAYSREQCERNAQIEGVGDRATFSRGNAESLPFASESFDAVVSNFVYHEVSSEPDKHALIRESLRVLKPGGAFALQDMMCQQSMYGDMEAFCDELRRDGIAEVHFEPHTEDAPFVPAYVKAPWMISGAGLLWGRK